MQIKKNKHFHKHEKNTEREEDCQNLSEKHKAVFASIKTPKKLK